MRIDLVTRQSSRFFDNADSGAATRPTAPVNELATGGPRRPIDAMFSKDGTTLYVVDCGPMEVSAESYRAFPGSGVVWKIIAPEKTGN